MSEHGDLNLVGLRLLALSLYNKMEKDNERALIPDTLDDIKYTDLVQLSRKLLDAIVASTKMLDKGEMTPRKLQEAKIVLGYLTATTSTVKAKMAYFKMVGIGDKVEAVKSLSKKI